MQIEFLKKISDSGGDVSDEGAISDERWNQLVAATDPQVIHMSHVPILLLVRCAPVHDRALRKQVGA